MNIGKSLALAFAVSLTGCAAQSIWDKAGATQQEFAQDGFGCSQIARATAPGGSVAAGGLLWVVGATVVSSISTHNQQQQIYNECMAAHGYSARGPVG